MTENVNIKEIEKKVFTAYHEDGILDISIGLWILIFGIGISLDIAWIGGIIPALVLPLWMAAKKVITVPRLGHVKFSPKYSSQMKKVRAVIAVAVVMGVVMLVMGVVMFLLFRQAYCNTPSWMDTLFHEYPRLLFGVLGAILFIASVWILGIRRLYGYAVLTFTIFVGGHTLGSSVHGEHLLVLLGTLIVVAGMAILIQFIRKHPVQKEMSG
ncbi:hypothetical protein DRN50_01940 [Thermococci archaeon]|nr:MAG: hypothetical protein DRN50_01940 [Thermococci archaeon]